jgi:hypothetical protein
MKNKAKSAMAAKGQPAKGKTPAKAPAKAEVRKDKPAAKPQPAKADARKDSKKPEPAKNSSKAGAKAVATTKPVAAKPQPVKAAPPKAAVKPASGQASGKEAAPVKGVNEKTGTAKAQSAKVEPAKDSRTDKQGLRRDGMAKAEAAAKKKSAPDSSDGPLLDMNDSTVKKFIKQAKARGFVTYDELNKVLPSDQNSSEQIEDIMSQLSEMGINVVESEDDVEDSEREQEASEDGEESEDGTPARSKSTALTTTPKDRYDRTDDPVRMYLREMGSVELLSREGEIAIAKRIEAGRDAMIRGLCESPLTFEAIMVWRQELSEERVLLRDIIDLEATYAAAHGGIVDNSQIVLQGGAPPPSTAPITAKKLAEAERAKEKAKPVKRVRDEDVDEVELERQKQAEAEAAEAEDDFDDGGAMSMSAMEAELREGVTKTLDAVGENFQRYRKLQERLVARKIEGKALTPKDYKEYDELVSAITENLKTLHLNNARIETLVEQLYEINKRLIQHEGKLMRLADLHGVGRQDFLDNYFGNELKPDWLDKVGVLSKQWKKFVTSEVAQDRRAARRRLDAGPGDGRSDRRLPPHRPDGPEGRARSPSGEEGDGGSQPPSRDLDRQEIHEPRPAIPGSHPGRQHRPDESGRQVRIPPRLQVLDLRHVVDPSGDHALDRGPGAHDPYPGAHDRDDQQDRPHAAPDAPRDRPRADAGRAG